MLPASPGAKHNSSTAGAIDKQPQAAVTTGGTAAAIPL